MPMGPADGGIHRLGAASPPLPSASDIIMQSLIAQTLSRASYAIFRHAVPSHLSIVLGNAVQMSATSAAFARAPPAAPPSNVSTNTLARVLGVSLLLRYGAVFRLAWETGKHRHAAYPLLTTYSPRNAVSRKRRPMLQFLQHRRCRAIQNPARIKWLERAPLP
jgi:hypothetical protein